MTATETTARGARTPPAPLAVHDYTDEFCWSDFTGCWSYTRADGWREVAGTHPLPPCPDRPVRHRQIVGPGWTV